MTLPKVSVVIVNYNNGQALLRCLKSLTNTRYDDFETIVVDDGTTDGSAEFVERMRKELARLSIITNHSNLGPAAARNIGVDASAGQYVAVLESDIETNQY